MLAGVGGKTIAEAKEAMSYAEFAAWLAYRRKRGPLHLAVRMDHGFALIATMVNHGLGGKAEMSDFLPYADEPAASLEDITKMMGVVPNG